MGLLLTYPTNNELDLVVQEYTAQTDTFIGAEILPEEEQDTQKVRWDEMDADRGMTAAHAMGSDPKTDKRPGSKTREFEPIPFKESDVLKENEILRGRELGTQNGVINLDREITRIAKARMDKTKIRVEHTRWQCLRGTLAINENGVIVNETFPVQSYDTLVPFSTVATATPLKDFNAAKLLFRGTGASAKGAKAYLNETTLNWMLENQNANDLKGFQNQNFVHLPYSVDEINKVLTSRSLPTLVSYDEGYIDENGVYQTFIQDGEIIIVGARPKGQKVGGWAMTPTLHRNKNGMPAPGYFSILEVNGQPNPGATNVDMTALGMGKNPKLEHTGGVYGGPLLRFPRSVIRMWVGA